MRKTLATLLLAGTSAAVFAGTAGDQIITPNPLTQGVAASQPVSVEINYTTSPLNNSLTGLGLRVHFDSSKLSFDSVSDPNPLNGVQPVSGPTSDVTDDFDGDSSTDFYVILSWIDFGSGFAGSDSASLGSVNFTTDASFSMATQVNFSTSSTPPGFTLSPTSATINFDDGIVDPPIIVPNLVGETAADAEAALLAAGYTTVNRVFQDSAATPGSVISETQDPSSFTATLTIAQAPL